MTLQKGCSLKTIIVKNDIVTKRYCSQANPKQIATNKYYIKRHFQLKVRDTASQQSNSQNNETTQNPTEYQALPAIQTGRRNLANIYFVKVIKRNTRKRCEICSN